MTCTRRLFSRSLSRPRFHRLRRLHKLARGSQFRPLMHSHLIDRSPRQLGLVMCKSGYCFKAWHNQSCFLESREIRILAYRITDLRYGETNRSASPYPTWGYATSSRQWIDLSSSFHELFDRTSKALEGQRGEEASVPVMAALGLCQVEEPASTLVVHTLRALR